MTTDDLTVHDDDRPDDALDTECIGHYPDLDAYLRTAVETLVLPEGQWLLNCLDLNRVRSNLESWGRYRLRVAGGRVLRDLLRSSPPTCHARP